MDSSVVSKQPVRGHLLSGFNGHFRLCAGSAVLGLLVLGSSGLLQFDAPAADAGVLSGHWLFILITTAALRLQGMLIWRLGRAMHHDLGGDPALAHARLGRIVERVEQMDAMSERIA
ncbi:hypothetical protein [Thiorhodovibrio frisius]|uniref:Uncharacterized protein n=1 Tax=Thiorhodovibrio frisius TaxID=631362 RepID=H8Z518_9GAMM|nr:hypothetical protein [Thiorhodovibrio frisius]EIC20425.1 hypothetical protein Thi970DRAFT_04059 [Thiorhodovibrio frisius]WPL21167.1 hypothetical protein Thiofri_01278 [Thiorhodovibrio frisius]